MQQQPTSANRHKRSFCFHATVTCCTETEKVILAFNKKSGTSSMLKRCATLSIITIYQVCTDGDDGAVGATNPTGIWVIQVSR
jgi:hypothetical protein